MIIYDIVLELLSELHQGGSIMDYLSIVGITKDYFAVKESRNIGEHIAVQVDITGKGHGAFYIEAFRDNIVIEPYEYYGHHAKMIVDGDTYIKLLKHPDLMINFLEERKVQILGDISSVIILFHLPRKTTILNPAKNIPEIVSEKEPDVFPKEKNKKKKVAAKKRSGKRTVPKSI